MKTIIVVFMLFPILLFGQNKNDENAINESLLEMQKEILKNEKANGKKVYVKKRIKNGTGVIIEYGTNIYGYQYNAFDTARYGRVSVIQEYVANKRNGRRIQFFNFPNDTASVETYINDTLNGLFFYNHLNGKIKTKGVNINGKPSNMEYWNNKGEKLGLNCSFNKIDSLIYFEGKPCSGHKEMYYFNGYEYNELAADLYFTKGKIDSAFFYNSYGYWGKYLGEIRLNYIDSTRKYISYYGPSGFTDWIYCYKIKLINPIKDINRDYAHQSIDNDVYEKSGKFTTFYDLTNVIREEGYYKNDIKVGEWRYYDESGKITKIEQY
ncbi:MAG: hypothetical protein WCK02_15905 [Bacteroidota bacterium]